MIAHLKTRYDSLREMARSYYKYTDCGMGMGAKVNGAWYYGSYLHGFESFESMEARGEEVEEICFSSIVEGVDQVTESHSVVDTHKTAEDFWKAVEAAENLVEDEAREIWNSTHGCEACASHWNEDGAQYEVGDCPVWEGCTECQGAGICI
jgi:hypothetical protein